MVTAVNMALIVGLLLGWFGWLYYLGAAYVDLMVGDGWVFDARFVEVWVVWLVIFGFDGVLHVVFVMFALDGGWVVIVVDGKLKSMLLLKRLVNIAVELRVVLFVDHYDDADWSAFWWVRVDGWVLIVIDGFFREAGVDALWCKYG